MKKSLKTSIVTTFLLLCVLTLPVLADDEDPVPDWEFNLAPMYLWAVNLSGDMSTMGASAPVDMGFDQIADSLEAIFTLHAEAQKGKWGILLDGEYMRVSDTENTPYGPVKLTLGQKIFETMGVYRVLLNEGMHFDFLGGFRYWNIETKLENTQANTHTETWLDPVIGGRFSQELDDEWTFLLRADFGGFGLGSDLTFNGSFMFDYQPWEHVSILLGGRVMDTYYKSNDFKYDITFTGPIVGLNFRW